jgi:hypothetical protein
MLLMKVGKSDREGTFSGAHRHGAVAPILAVRKVGIEQLNALRVFGRLPVTGVRGCTEAGVRKASREETAEGARTDAGVDLWGICRRCLI